MPNRHKRKKKKKLITYTKKKSEERFELGVPRKLVKHFQNEGRKTKGSTGEGWKI